MALVPLEWLPWIAGGIILVVIDQTILQGRFTNRIFGFGQRVSIWTPNPGCYYQGQYVSQIEELGHVTALDGLLGERKVKRLNLITSNGERIAKNEPLFIDIHALRQWNTEPYTIMDLPSAVHAVFEENGRLKQDLENAKTDRETSYLSALDFTSKVAVSMGGVRKELGIGVQPWIGKRTPTGARINVPVGEGEGGGGEGE